MTDYSKFRFPGIVRATVEMSRCNGGINVHRKEASVIYDLNAFLQHGPEIAFDLAAISDHLMKLDDDQLLTAVDGEESEMKALLETAPTGTHKLLDDIFDHVA